MYILGHKKAADKSLRRRSNVRAVSKMRKRCNALQLQSRMLKISSYFQIWAFCFMGHQKECFGKTLHSS